VSSIVEGAAEVTGAGSPASNAPVVLRVTGGVESVRVKDDVAVASAPQRFLRLRLSLIHEQYQSSFSGTPYASRSGGSSGG